MLTGTCHCDTVRWTFDGMPDTATACNCTLCRRYGVLWIYDYEGERIGIEGPAASYTRADMGTPELEILFCPKCGCVASWRALSVNDGGRRRMAVNVRLSEPGSVAHLPIRHFEGLDAFEDLPGDGRCVADIWF
jgi:hypothetical protein